MSFSPAGPDVDNEVLQFILHQIPDEYMEHALEILHDFKEQILNRRKLRWPFQNYQIIFRDPDVDRRVKKLQWKFKYDNHMASEYVYDMNGNRRLATEEEKEMNMAIEDSPLLSEDLPLLHEPNPKAFDKPNAVAIGPIINTNPTIVNYRSNNNQLRGMLKRVAHGPTFDGFLFQQFKAFVQKELSAYEPLPHQDWDLEFVNKEWLDVAKHYNESQKSMFRFLFQKFVENQHSSETHKNLYACNSFIKREFYAESKEPRIINSRSDMFKVVVAPYIKGIEHAVIYNKHFIKGKAPQERVVRMQEILDRFKFVAETDYSSFEGSFSWNIQKYCEASLFKHMLSNNLHVWKIIEPIYAFNSRNKCVFANSRQYMDVAQFSGSRMSGDMWTSLANGFTNMMLFKFVVDYNARLKRLPIDYDFIVEGDDGFLAFNVMLDLAPIKDLGFQLKIVSGTDLNDLSFCGTCLGPDATPVPDFWRTIEKFGWSFDDHIIDHYHDKPTKAEMELLYAKALSLQAESEGIPILQPLALKCLELSHVHKLAQRYITYYEEHILQLSTYVPVAKPITQEMRVFFADRFGVSIEDQLKIEDYIGRQTSPRFVVPMTRPLQC